MGDATCTAMYILGNYSCEPIMDIINNRWMWEGGRLNTCQLSCPKGEFHTCRVKTLISHHSCQRTNLCLKLRILGYDSLNQHTFKKYRNSVKPMQEKKSSCRWWYTSPIFPILKEKYCWRHSVWWNTSWDWERDMLETFSEMFLMSSEIFGCLHIWLAFFKNPF